jgi:uncharacterized protein
MGQPVVFFEVLGKDGDALRSFYGQLFGWQYEAMPPMDYGMVGAAGDTGISGGVGAAPDGGPGHVTFYVQTDDPQAALSKAENLGGKTVQPPTAIPGGGVIALVADPEGHRVGLFKPPTGG